MLGRARASDVRPVQWRAADLAGAPPAGIVDPAPLDCDGERLHLRHARWVDVIGFLALVLALVPLFGLILLILDGVGVPLGFAGPLKSFVSVGAMATCVFAAARLGMPYLARAGHLDLNARTGWGELSRGVGSGAPVWGFALSRVRRVILLHLDRAAAKPVAAVQLHCVDDRGEEAALSACSCPVDRAGELARQIADWLRVELAECDYQRRLRPVHIPIRPQSQGDEAACVEVPVTAVGKPRWFSLGPPLRMSRGGEDLLRLGPPRGVWILGGLCLFVSLAMIFLAVTYAAKGEDVAVMAALLGSIPAAGTALLWTAVGRWRFDRAAGSVRFRGGFRGWRQIAMPSVVAVQSLNENAENDEADFFELNLVLASGERETISRDASEKWTRRTGPHLAAFLGVPWIDHVTLAPPMVPALEGKADDGKE